MTKNYREELPKLDKIPDSIYAIYIIPYEAYDGFWGKNGYMSYDFVFCDRKDELGWLHWEGDVINIFNNIHELALSIDCPVNCGYLRLFSHYKIKLDNLLISSVTISVER